MSKSKTNKEIILHKDIAITKLQNLIDEFIKADSSKADKFCYWLEDYSAFLSYEKEFDAKKLKRYKRGDIIKAHLGFNIGSEEGGLHYCMVLENNNNLYSPVITVIPLTSIKNDDRAQNLHKGEVFIGNELYTALQRKIDTRFAKVTQKFNDITTQPLSDKDFHDELDIINRELESIGNMKNELSKMKNGSIALVGQITTISKIRIYTPKTKYDTLSGIRFSPETLDKIDNEICKLFTKNS